MITEDIENTNDQERNDSVNTWANFVDPHEYMDNKSARISTKNGKIIYEIEIPFGIEDYCEVSKEEYDQHVQERKTVREEEKLLYEKRQVHKKRLQDIWYISHNETRWGDDAYESRILQLLENKNLKTIKQIAGYVEEWTKGHQIQLFQTLAKKEKAPDFYEKSISDFLDKYEPIIENIFIGEDEITHIGQLFVIWCIDDIQLFYRFEEFKRANTRNHYKRIYLFWIDKKGSKHTSEKKEFLQDEDMWYILYFLKYKDWTIRDLDDDENRFRNKVKASYIHELKEFRLGRWRAWFWDRYSGFEQKKLMRTLWFTDEDFRNWTDQARKEFVNDFSQMVTHMNIDTIPFSLAKLQENITRIWQSTDTSKLKSAICIWLKTCIAQWIQKIIDKDKPTKMKWEQKKLLSYKLQINNMTDNIEALYKELEKIDSNAAESTWWKANKETYIQEYKDYHRNTFIQKRLIEVLKVDINDKEALEQQTLHDVEKHFLSSCKKHIESKLHDSLDYNPLSKRTIIRFIIASFFRTWHALVLKTTYPNDKERKALRQKYVQIITKNILSDTETRLADSSTFSATEYYMREPLYYLYKRYWWQEDLLATQDSIETTYQQYLEKIFEKNWADIIKKIEKDFSSGDVLDIKTTYKDIMDFTVFVKKHIWAMMKKHTTTRTYTGLDESLQQNKTYNQKNNNIYPQWLINNFSFHWYMVEDAEKHLSEDILTQCIDWYTKTDILIPQVLQTILQWRFDKNGQVWWKLQRLSQEIIICEFGVITLSKEQIDFLLQYFTEHLSNIILQDLALSSDWIDLFWSDKELVKTYIEQYMEAFKHNITLLTNEQKYFKKSPL